MCHLFASQSPETYETHTRSVRIGGHVTSLRLEAVFWDILEELAADQGMSLGRFVTRLHDEVLELHGDVRNFTSLLRCCCLKYVSGLRPVASGEAPAFDLVAAE
ncbi:ribbon-helix-helix domain-containing protein [Labrys neptuniae]